MEPKRWTDQPDEVMEHPILARIFLSSIGHTVEVRSGYYITIGNLFGSQTIKAQDADTVIRLLGATACCTRGAEVNIENFPGVQLIEGVTHG